MANLKCRLKKRIPTANFGDTYTRRTKLGKTTTVRKRMSLKTRNKISKRQREIVRGQRRKLLISSGISTGGTVGLAAGMAATGNPAIFLPTTALGAMLGAGAGELLSRKPFKSEIKTSGLKTRNRK